MNVQNTVDECGIGCAVCIFAWCASVLVQLEFNAPDAMDNGEI